MPGPVTVREQKWRIDPGLPPAIKIMVGRHYVLIEYEDARRVVDSVHDLCDLHDRNLRERSPGD